MRKILAGFILALVIGVPAVYFGLPLWAQRQAVRQVDAAFEGIGSAIGKASHGAVSYDLWTRTLKIADVLIESSDSPATVLKAGQIVATRSSPSPDKFAAERLEIINSEISGLQFGDGSPRIAYRAPRIVLENYAGPVAPGGKAGSDKRLVILEAVAGLTASAVSIPTLSATASFPPQANTLDTGAVEYGLTALSLRDVADGKIAAATAERITMTGNMPDVGATTAEIDKLELTEIDLNSALAAIDPAKQKDTSYRRVYATITTGPYRLSLNDTGTVRFDSLRLDDLAIKPAVFADPDIFNLSGKLRSGALSLAETRAIYDKLATVYEGIRIGKFEARGLISEVGPGVSVKIGAMRLAGMEDGKIAELAIDAVDARVPANEPITIGRAALKGIDLVKIMRSSAQIRPDMAPSSEQALALLSMFSGAELKDFSFEKISGRPTRIENLSLSWGKFFGAIPSQIRATTQLSAAIDPDTKDRTLLYFLDAGVKNIAASLDLGADWNETTRSLTISPLSADLADLYSATAKLVINNVPRAAFSGDPVTTMQTVPQLELGGLELSTRDLGGLDLVFKQMAKDQQTTPEAVRRITVDMIRTLALNNPEIETIGAAIARQLENPGTTLTIVLTPKTRVNLLQAIESARSDPLSFLGQFDVEARTAR